MSQILLPSAPEFRQLPPPAIRSLRASVLDGAFAQLMASLTSGFLLTGFAVELGMREAQIGLLAALPAFGNLSQLLGPALVARWGSRKAMAVRLAAAARLLWLVMLFLPFVSLPAAVLFLGAIALNSLLGALSGVAWMAWMAEVVPEQVRGRFFGHRNMVAGLVGMVGAWSGGQFIDYWRARLVPAAAGWPTAVATLVTRPGAEFSVVYAVALGAGLASLAFLSRVAEPSAAAGAAAMPEGPDGVARAEVSAMAEPAVGSPGAVLATVFSDPPFRKLLTFGVVWAFAVGIGGPFIDLYQVRNLGLPFGVLALLGVVNGLFNILGMRIWGEFSDRWGTLPALAISSAGAAVLPLLWVFATPGAWGILWPANALSGLSWAGVGLVSSTLLMKMAPREKSAAYFGTYAALTGLAGAVAPAVGGYLGSLLSSARLTFGGRELEGLQILFLITAVARMLSLALLRGVRPPREPSPEQLLEALQSARIRVVQPAVLAAGQWAQYGMATAENLSAAVSRGSLAMEAQVESLVQLGERMVARADRAWSRWVERSERLCARWINGVFDRMEQALARLRRWWE
ncbi:MAG: MFS transporter [Limnochordaceae bacterium]|nr:MFS transporter [Limnochordaceae bacterium]